MTRKQRKAKQEFFWNVATIAMCGTFVSTLVVGVFWASIKI